VPPEREIPGSPADWMVRARSDLAFARSPLPEGAVYEDLCFHAQQAAEKAIKAVYRSRGRPFRYTHDIEDLLDGLKREGVAIPSQVEGASDLTSFAWETRYPGVGESIDEHGYRVALRQAEAVVAWAEGLIAQSKGQDSKTED